MFQQDYQKFSPCVFHKTPEGYLTGRLCVTGAGVFRYLNDDKKFIGRLRSVEQVKKATPTINCKPVTLLHPNQPVTLDNVSNLQVGMSANDAQFDGLNNWVTVTVTDKKAVEAIENGSVKAISMGYKCNVIDNAGVWQGSKHDQEQQNIEYNHIALVKDGRAGDQVRFMVGDSSEAEEIFDIKPIDDLNNKGNSVVVNDNKLLKKETKMKTIQLDGVDYEADEKVIEALQKAQNDAAEKLDEIQTLLDSVTNLEDQVSDLENLVDEDDTKSEETEFDEMLIDDAVNSKLAVLDAARKAGIDCYAIDDISDLKREVIKTAFENIDLDPIEDEGSLNSLFSSACSVLGEEYDDSADETTERKPATQLDAVSRKGLKVGIMAQGDSMEDALAQQLFNISNGIKEKE